MRLMFPMKVENLLQKEMINDRVETRKPKTQAKIQQLPSL